MPISFSNKAIFVHIPKTGGQSISRMLGIRKGNLKQYYGREVKEGQKWKDGLVLTHLTIKQIKTRIDVSGFYIFSFVRDPYTRIISEYNWRMRNRIVFEEPIGQLMGFSEYCELLLSKWDEIMDSQNITERQHVTPQYKYVDKDVEIYRYENFDQECDKIKKKLNITSLTHKDNTGKYNTEHTERTIEITNELYAEDFKRFDYDYITQT